MKPKFRITPVQIGLILTIIITLLCIRPQIVNGESMLPTLKNNEIVLMQSALLCNHTFSKGDIVVIQKDMGGKKYVKRVIAEGGDSIQVMHDMIYINNKPLYEPYLKEIPFDTPLEVDMVVPEGNYFVCGDNRNNSYDSRNGLGIISSVQIKGKLIAY